jgi:hypothetical protein
LGNISRIVAATVFRVRLLLGRTHRLANATGESWHFGIDNTPPASERGVAFLESCGLSLGEQRNFEAETDRKRAMASFATAIVSSVGNR